MNTIMNYQKPRTTPQPVENIMYWMALAAAVIGSLALILGAWIYEL